jgi:undecaprenyl diphosphate synthase
MDGNGRWAVKRGLPRIFGHRAAVKTVRSIVEQCADLGIEVLTLYAFSTENWVRPKMEVRGLMAILKKYLRKELPTMMRNNIRFRTIGDISYFPPAVQQEIQSTIDATKGNSGMFFNLALNYGGRQDIVRAVNGLILKGIKEVDERSFGMYLDTAGLPDPDLLIRTSGEMRLSNFLLWQVAYAELYITPVLWPDFNGKNLLEAIQEYQKRDRRFGGVKTAPSADKN